MYLERGGEQFLYSFLGLRDKPDDGVYGGLYFRKHRLEKYYVFKSSNKTCFIEFKLSPQPREDILTLTRNQLYCSQVFEKGC